MRSIVQGIILFAGVFAPAHYALAQVSSATLTVRGDIQKPGEWTVETLRQQFAKQTQTVKFTAGDKQQNVGTGIPLYSLIQEAALKTEKAPKHYDLSFLVILEARDSYRVYFSLAELAPQCGHAQVWLIWDIDGKPLSDKEAPFRLVVSSDQGHDRHIYGISTLTLVDGTKLANQLAGRR
jgi:DMSO/TMAO reductase YedYZ molybdopterin-dependent catalytic subunit